MNTFFLGIVIFLIVLAAFDLVVGVSNDAVNFLNSAIGAKVAKFKTIVLIAAIGVFAGAAMSNGMMDVARHGIMTPEYFSFYDVMCVFLAVMVTDVILLDIFNTLGMPTSTTVSMVFELLGGAFAIALIKILQGATDIDGNALSLGDLLNTEKALSVIMGIFLSVAIAFVLGTIVQWIARVIFTFTYRVNGKTTDVNGNMGGHVSTSLKIGIFGGIAVTSIIWFLLINGLKNSSFMTSELKGIINDNTWIIIGGGLVVFSTIMTILSAFKAPVLKFVVLLGTFALAMAFAGNDLVNFVGVPLTGLDAYNDFMAHSNGDASAFMMKSLMNSAQTPAMYLVLAGVVMVLSLVFSKKAQNVVKTSVNLSRQDEGDEMFGSSAVARVIVRNTQKTASLISEVIPESVGKWIDSRFNADGARLADGAAFDLIRAAVNLVLAGLLVALGTSMKLPLSTTYVTFMVAMGSSLADRAWSRESAVFRITGVLSVIGGWFITAGAAFIMCYLVTNVLHFGSFVAMALAIAMAIIMLIRSNMKFKSETTTSESDLIFKQLCHSHDKTERWQLLKMHVAHCNADQLHFASECYKTITDAFFQEEYRPLRHVTHKIETARKQLKRQRRREIIGLRKIDSILAMEKNTWYFLANSSMEQILYCLKRINDPCREHVGNSFTPVSREYTYSFLNIQKQMQNIFQQAEAIVSSSEQDKEKVSALRAQAESVQNGVSDYRKLIIDSMQQNTVNIESATVFLNIIQESQQILSCIRHMLRGMEKFNK
ncbi:MAG: inorganic phosphate transporter [Prevotellaceae bacterium]|nr:inorganic phosphate transporter [Prevotellaceae bacterium]